MVGMSSVIDSSDLPFWKVGIDPYKLRVQNQYKYQKEGGKQRKFGLDISTKPSDTRVPSSTGHVNFR